MPRHEVRQHDRRPDAAVILRDGKKAATVHKTIGDTVTDQTKDMSDDQANASMGLLLAALLGGAADPDCKGIGSDADGDPVAGFGEGDDLFDPD